MRLLPALHCGPVEFDSEKKSHQPTEIAFVRMRHRYDSYPPARGMGQLVQPPTGQVNHAEGTYYPVALLYSRVTQMLSTEVNDEQKRMSSAEAKERLQPK